MEVTAKRVVALIVRSENEKTPVCIFEHELLALASLHGADAVRETKDAPPKGSEEGTFDTAEEYSRLEQMYVGNNENPRPIFDAYGSLRDFEAMFKDNGKKTTKTEDKDPDAPSKEDLLALAEEMGIEVKGTWGVPKLTEVIAAAKLAQEAADAADNEEENGNED